MRTPKRKPRHPTNYAKPMQSDLFYSVCLGICVNIFLTLTLDCCFDLIFPIACGPSGCLMAGALAGLRTGDGETGLGWLPVGGDGLRGAVPGPPAGLWGGGGLAGGPGLCGGAGLLAWNEDNWSRVVRKPAFCICENKDADQLRGNRKADQRLCFRYIDSTIPLLPKYKISSL